MTRLSDEELSDWDLSSLSSLCSCGPYCGKAGCGVIALSCHECNLQAWADLAILRRMTPRLLAEIRQSRASALTGMTEEERQALRFARKCVESAREQLQRIAHLLPADSVFPHQGALAVLDSLLATTKGEP